MSEVNTVATQQAGIEERIDLSAAGADFMNRLVARGERVQWETEELIREVMGQFRLQPHAPDPDQPLGGGLTWLTQRLGIPSQRDLRLLHAWLDQISADVEALSLKQPDAEHAVSHSER